MEGGATMGEGHRGVEDHNMSGPRRFWGLRPWKRHSQILMVAGLIYALVGISYVFAEPNKNRALSLVVLIRIAPIEVWGMVFTITGLLSAISSRWPPFAETWGYMVLTGLSTGWAFTYLFGILFFGSPIMNISGFFIWGLLAFLWWAISGLLNPDTTSVEPNHE